MESRWGVGGGSVVSVGHALVNFCVCCEGRQERHLCCLGHLVGTLVGTLVGIGVGTLVGTGVDTGVGTGVGT